MDYEPAYSTVDFVVGLRVESAHANNSTHTLLLLLRCCCYCVPKLTMCPSITGFPYRYVGVFDVGDMKKTTEKNRVGFSVSFFLGNRKTDFKKSVFCCEKSNKNDQKKTTKKNDFRFSAHNARDMHLCCTAPNKLL